jgi:hypothetical protein
VSNRASQVTVLLVWASLALASPAQTPAPPPQMTAVAGKDVSGTIYKKLGLPDRHYCWDICLKEARCSGVRWGVVAGDAAGLCLFITGPLTFKDLVEPRTEDGKAIQVTVARKDVPSGSGT